MNTTLLAAAISGILLGSSGLAHAHTIQTAFAGASADTVQELGGDAAKHGCKAQNACKGQGGCKTDKNACKGQNSCKGQGGCKTETKKSDKNGCGGANGCGAK